MSDSTRSTVTPRSANQETARRSTPIAVAAFSSGVNEGAGAVGTVRKDEATPTTEEPMADVTIDRSHYVMLIELASKELAHSVADKLVWDGKSLAFGDTLGSVLAVAWSIDHDLPAFAMVGFVAEVRAVCEQAERPAPTLDAILDTLQFSFNEARYVAVDFDELARHLRHDVPLMLG